MRVSFTEELSALEASLQEEGDLVLRALRSSLNALARGDQELDQRGEAHRCVNYPRESGRALRAQMLACE